MAKFYDSNNKLDVWADKHPDTKKWKGSWKRTQFTMAIQKMKTPKLQFNEKIGRIIWGKPKDEK